MNILVLGGTKFVGKRLVNLLLEEGHQVTVGSRGQTEAEFNAPVERLQLDRKDEQSLAAALEGRTWDVIYDQICYSPQDARLAAKLFSGKTKRYIEVSSMSVYDQGPDRLSEGAWSPAQYPLSGKDHHALSYKEGKREAEAVLWEEQELQAVMVRFPIILGPDDYTKRLHWHVQKVLQQKPIGVPASEALISFVHSAEAAEFLSWLKDNDLTGPVNCCSVGEISIGEIIRLVEQETGKAALIQQETSDAEHSPFGIGDSWYLDHSKAAEVGFAFYRLNEWLPKLVKQLVEEESSASS